MKPSNLIVLGTETACRIHIQQVFETFPKERHNLTQRCIDNKDKQNYSSIPILVSDNVHNCLLELKLKTQNTGTLIYLNLMRKIRDAIFDKELSPIERIHKIWRVVFFCRIWRKWLNLNGYSEKDHFLTPNVYLCIEINSHMILGLVIKVMKGELPKECLRVWTTGSQACEQMFRLLRSMSGTFSTIVNFSLKGILERINELNYVASIECTEEIIFPRVKRRLLQLSEESEETLLVPSSLECVHQQISLAKLEAIEDAKECSMSLPNYDDDTLMMENISLIELTENEDDNVDVPDSANVATSMESSLNDDLALQEDLLQIRLRKQNQQGMPLYETTDEKGTKSHKSYKSSKFIEYSGAYIRKSTALYLLQENQALSSDRLIRVREGADTSSTNCQSASSHTLVSSGDLCIFKRIDDVDKLLIGRIVQFSYLKGTKRQQEYSGMYVDLTKDYRSNGVFANWFAMFNLSDSTVEFRPLVNVFTQGYISMENYLSTIPDSNVTTTENGFFLQSNMVIENVDNWKNVMSKISDFACA